MVQSAVELQEQLALARHINNYGWLADDFNWKEIAYIFTEDTVFDFKVPSDLEKQEPMNFSGTQIKGRDSTAQALSYFVSKFKRTQHSIMNMDFDIDPSGTTATGRANIIWAGVGDDIGRHYVAQTGSRYKWKFQKHSETGKWETAYTLVDILWVNSTLVDGFRLATVLPEGK